MDDNTITIKCDGREYIVSKKGKYQEKVIFINKAHDIVTQLQRVIDAQMKLVWGQFEEGKDAIYPLAKYIDMVKTVQELMKARAAIDELLGEADVKPYAEAEMEEEL